MTMLEIRRAEGRRKEGRKELKQYSKGKRKNRRSVKEKKGTEKEKALRRR